MPKPQWTHCPSCWAWYKRRRHAWYCARYTYGRLKRGKRRAAYCPRPKRKRQGKREAFSNPNPTMGTIRRWELRLLRTM